MPREIVDADSGSTQWWKDVKSSNKERRASNTVNSTEWLKTAGIPFESKNDGAHLVVTTAQIVVDFWPSSGLWIVRGEAKHRYGVRQLIAFVKARP